MIWLFAALHVIDNVFDCWNGGWLKSLVCLYGSVINCLSLLRISSFFRGNFAEILNFSFYSLHVHFFLMMKGEIICFQLFCAQSILAAILCSIDFGF